MDSNTYKKLESLCAALAYAIGIDAPECAADPNEDLCQYIDKAFHGRKASRIFMYNPDAIGQWISDKYGEFMSEVENNHELKIPFRTVMPAVTPVCFATMYTGAVPQVHGIQRYEKPAITIDTLFDALIRAGKKAVILGDPDCSLLHIFLERNMDYIACETEAETLARAAELIVQDEYDFIVCYNGNYDARMHRYGPESSQALAELRCNAQAYGMINALIQRHWSKHDTLVAFAMDHGCHEIHGGCGSHGLDMPEDIDIVHYYKAYPAK